MPQERLELSRTRHWLLRPACLPFHHQGIYMLLYSTFKYYATLYRNTLAAFLRNLCRKGPTLTNVFLYSKLIAGRIRTCTWYLIPTGPITGLCLPFHHREFLRLITPQYGCRLQTTLAILKHTARRGLILL